ncbi:hypothetical protein [Actinoplanes rectilineatus]|uniref:hypothetical protein n=1 Tax=Actinoplanes rectilineatus TaxID=113571 RepID=UPI0005F2DBA4|nr:hypothetical protein [Actinoplanes rectilineatus]
MTGDAIDQELKEVAGSGRLAAEIRRNLESLRSGVAGPALAEMARDILAGRITLRDVAQTLAYSEPLLEALAEFRKFESQLSADERAEMVEQAKERFSDPDSRSS